MKNILFLDIETVASNSDYNNLDERLKYLWKEKASRINNEEGSDPEELFKQRAGIFAEFGKIVVIAVGSIRTDKNGPQLRVKALSSNNEHQLLSDFKNLLEKFNQDQLLLCAHNGQEFDFPFLCRRMLINGISLPQVLDISGKKPWQVPHLDTLQLWKFGDFKNYTSLDLLAAVFGIDSSKNQIDGSMVNEVYYKEGDLDKITEYCKQDVVVLAQVYRKIKGLPLVKKEQIAFV
ncbi:3'-5' exonuclease [Xanthovirga aplysinae]|uniref:3'-5' exonuclease n=1 Tax=Xanthovirga aplysinae TaxID=2529853 RepID=UPI0012BC087C|nr:3'-5' exonuclease [Xanthovirga aplysinae]MTI32062.1 3'-5' exonuclease [Xanthovirga aplysinae]